MTVYYARGGGLGHVTRARRVLDALGIDAEIVTRVPESLPDRMIVDAFPGGLEGELCELDVPMDYVARLLRWNEYRRAVPGALPRFETTYVVEELTPAHEAFVRAHSARIVRLDLSVAAVASAADLDDYCLVVHSGPEHEVRELVAFATELDPPRRIVVASPFRIEGYAHVDAYPVSHLFASAARIVSAAGFNVMLETEPYRDKHVVVPFPRKFDDQFARAARRRATASAPRPTRPPRTDTSVAAR